MEQVKMVLKQFGELYITANGKLKRSAVMEALDQYDQALMTALLSNNMIYKTYTETILGTEIFKLNQFIEMFEYKDYWEDSFTKYENKIGLTVGGKFLDESADVVLDFPFKDTLLKAGMNKEDLVQGDSANEPFLNETIAKPEIDELLEPKVLVNAQRYDKNGKQSTDTILNTDNLIIKGNNLIALHSLKKRYAGKIKLIYLDPPYYFNMKKPSDSFSYNTNFKLSSWLTFLKNRLEIARELLCPNGTILVSIGEDGQAYLKILLDEVFKKSNFVETFLWKNTDNADSLSKQSRSGVEYIHAYQKNRDTSQRWIGKDSENGDAPLLNSGNGITKKVFPPNSIHFAIPDGTYKKGKYQNIELLSDAVVTHGLNVNEIVMSGRFKWGQKTIENEINNGTYFIVKTLNFSVRFQRQSASVMSPEKWVDNTYLSKIFGVGTNEDATSHLRSIDITFTNPKPESLIAFFVRAITKKDEYVLDFFMGSATTQAVALKMHRRFIGIEQMDYIKSVSVPRLQKVIAGEQGGISKDVDWQGGGSFVYAELFEKNQGYLKDLLAAEDNPALEMVYERMKAGADLDFRVDLTKYDDEKLDLPFDERKRLLLKMLDKNQLYYNYADIDDADVRELISDNDYAFNQSFYGKECETGAHKTENEKA